MPDQVISTEQITKLSEGQLKARIAFADFAAKKSVLEKLKKGKKIADLDKEDKELLGKGDTQESLQAKLDELEGEVKEAKKEAEKIVKKTRSTSTSPTGAKASPAAAMISPMTEKPTLIIPNNNI